MMKQEQVLILEPASELRFVGKLQIFYSKLLIRSHID